MATTATRPSRKTTAKATPEAAPAADPIAEMDALITAADEEDVNQDVDNDPTGQSTDIDEDGDTYPDDEDEDDEDAAQGLPVTVISEDGVEDGTLNDDDSISVPQTKEEKEGAVQDGPVVGTLRTADGKKVTVRDAKPPTEESDAEKAAKAKKEMIKAQEEARKAVEKQLVKIETSKAPVVKSLLGVFEAGEQMALIGIRNKIHDFSDDELRQIDIAARTAESTGWRMANTVRYEIVLRLKKAIEDRQLKGSDTGVIDEDKVRKNLVGHMGRVAGEMGITPRELYNSANLERTFFHEENKDPDGNVITKEQIDQAISVLKGRTFLVEALLADKKSVGKPSPAYALLLMADHKMAMPKYGIRDAREHVKQLNAGTYGKLLDDGAKTPEDLLDRPEGQEDADAASRTQAAPTTRVADLRVSDISGPAVALVSVLVDAARMMAKKTGGKMYIFQDERGIWTSGTDEPKIAPGKPAAIWLTVERDNVYFSANIA